MAEVVDLVPDKDRRWFRKFLPPERLALQGFNPELAETLGLKMSIFSAGNAYPVNLLLAVWAPIMKAIEASSVDLTKWPEEPTPKRIPDSVTAIIQSVTKELLKKGRVDPGVKGKGKGKSSKDCLHLLILSK